MLGVIAGGMKFDAVGMEVLPFLPGLVIAQEFLYVFFSFEAGDLVMFLDFSYKSFMATLNLGNFLIGQLTPLLLFLSI